MPLVPALARAQTRRVVLATLDDAVTVLGAAVDTVGDFGETVPGVRPEIARAGAASGSIRADVEPESTAERQASDRTATETGYRVRVESTPALAALTGAAAIRWDRPARDGGPVTLDVEGDPIARGSFLVFRTVHRS